MQTDSEGWFQIRLPPGTYWIEAASDPDGLIAKPQVVTVQPNGFKVVIIAYDGGIQ